MNEWIASSPFSEKSTKIYVLFFYMSLSGMQLLREEHDGGM